NDKRLLEINKVIYNKLYMMGQARIFNNESKRLYGVDYPTYYRQRTMVEIAKKVSKPLSKVLSDAYLDMANYGRAEIMKKEQQ
ncbi:MAG: hypothetical protein IJQ55_00195, partial [Alphaproteobacteria bacterium]|nr:hypothetical protein [Alphaproteobacteria bacterium]